MRPNSPLRSAFRERQENAIMNNGRGALPEPEPHSNRLVGLGRFVAAVSLSRRESFGRNVSPIRLQLLEGPQTTTASMVPDGLLGQKSNHCTFSASRPVAGQMLATGKMAGTRRSIRDRFSVAALIIRPTCIDPASNAGQTKGGRHEAAETIRVSLSDPERLRLTQVPSALSFSLFLSLSLSLYLCLTHVISLSICVFRSVLLLAVFLIHEQPLSPR